MNELRSESAYLRPTIGMNDTCMLPYANTI